MTKPMRLFLAVNLADNDHLRETLETLRNTIQSGSCTAPQNLHMTLHFIGETARGTDLARILDDVARTEPPFCIQFGELGQRGKPGDALVWLRGRSDALLSLQSKLTTALTAAGFEIERRTFLPHVTLARRVRFPSQLQNADIQNTLAGLKADFSVPVRRISLMSSERVKGALVYRERHSAQLETQAKPEG